MRRAYTFYLIFLSTWAVFIRKVRTEEVVRIQSLYTF